MSLPKVDLPRYKHKLFGYGEITYRPFTVKEQKILLLSKESEDENEKIESIKQILELCTFNKIDVNELAVFDVEDLFIRIRCKSVSEVSELNYNVKDANTGEKTGEQVQVSVNLDELKVEPLEGHNPVIKINDSMGIRMKYPSISMMSSQTDMTEEDIMMACIDVVYDGDEVFNLSEHSRNDIQEFYESLDMETLTAMSNFFSTMPRIRHEETVTLKDGTEETLVFEGLESFFD